MQTNCEQFLAERRLLSPTGLVEKYEFKIKLRHEFVMKFGFAILTDDAVEKLSHFGPLLEVGAGSGYWAFEMRRANVDVLAVDTYSTRYGFFGVQIRTLEAHWGSVDRLDGRDAVVLYPERTLLMVWPDMAEWPLATAKRFAGSTILYVGEWDGCTADRKFHEYLGNHFNIEAVPIPQFDGIHDELFICRRRW